MMNTTNNTWFSRLKNRLHLGSSGDDYSFSKENDHFYQKTMKRFGEWNKKHFDKPTIMNEMANDGKDIQIIGVQDGMRGQNPAAMRQIVDHVASLWKAFIESTFQEQHAVAKKKLDGIQRTLAYLIDKRDRLIDYQDMIFEDYKLNPKNYNWMLAFVYIGISMILITADLPLTIDVVRNGFNITEIPDKTTLGLTDVELIAWGLVFISIYFKLFYDEFIGSSTKTRILQMRPEVILGSKFIASGQEIERAEKINRSNFISKLIILSLLLLTLCCLGMFRSGYMEVATDIKTTKSSTSVQNVPSNNTTSSTSAQNPQSNSNPLLDNPFRKLYSSGTSKTLFILLSIMFPLIGGVCASVGVNTLQNALNRLQLGLRLRRLQSRIQRVEKKESIADGTVESCKANISWVQETDFIKTSADYFFSYYLHGFEWGLNVKLPDQFYSVAKEMRTHHSKIKSTQIFYKEMAKSTESSGHLNTLMRKI